MTQEEKILYWTDQILKICEDKRAKDFDGFVPFIPDLYDVVDPDAGLWQDVTPDCLYKKLNISYLMLGDPELPKAAKEWQLRKIRELSAKEMRKRHGVFCMKPFSLDIAYENGVYMKDCLQWAKGDFRPVQINGSEINEWCFESFRYCATIGLALQFNLENQPYVYIKPESAFCGFILPIGRLEQLKGLFKLRDIPDGKKRRAALRHWVSKYMRRIPSNPDELTEVKKHLRGAKEFNWFGMECKIITN